MKRNITRIICVSIGFGFFLTYPMLAQSFFSKAQASVHSAPLSYIPPLYKDPYQQALLHIQTLRKKGKTDEALSYIKAHMSQYPNDVDVELLWAIVLYQKKDYANAHQTFQRVLKTVPTYIDAQVGLVNVEIAQKHDKKALASLENFLQASPKNEQLLALKAKLRRILAAQKTNKHPAQRVVSPIQKAIEAAEMASKHKQPTAAKNILKAALNNAPGDDGLCVALANQYLEFQHDLAALSTISRCLKVNPHSTVLYKKLGEIFVMLVEYPQAAQVYQKALALKPDDQGAQGALNEISALTPYYTYGLNEIGMFSDNAYVNDLHSIWDYTTLFFNRNISFGRIGGRINYASRLGQTAPQVQIDFSPRYNRQLYFDFSTAFANKPELFPDWMAYGEAYYNVPEFLEFSAGLRYSNIGPTYFTTYTASMNKYTEHYLFSFRPYYFVPKTHDTSVLYTGLIRRYFETLDHFISVNLGAGRSPDLSDLLTVNFIKIRNYFAFLNYEFPIVNHQFIVDVGAGYQLWQYPNGLNRNLYDGLIGIKYRFG